MEQTNLLHEFSEPTYAPASTGQRLANYLIDLIVFYAIIFLFALVFGYSGMGSETIGIGTYYLSMFAIFLGYYTLFEGAKGKTLGKMVTKTKVIT